MRSILRVSTCAFLVLACAAQLAAAGPSASGSFRFEHDGFTRAIELDVHQVSSSGRASGEMTFNGITRLYEQDVDGEGVIGRHGAADVTMRVELDCLRLAGHKAVASGRVASASISSYVGRRVVLAIEDGETDRFTWHFYRPTEIAWPVSDAEREDDVPVPAMRSQAAACQTFSLSGYEEWNALPKDAGDIQVTP